MPRPAASGNVSHLWDAVKQGLQAFQNVVNVYSHVDVDKLQKDNQELKDRMYSLELQVQEMILSQEEKDQLHDAESSAHAEERDRLERELVEV